MKRSRTVATIALALALALGTGGCAITPQPLESEPANAPAPDTTEPTDAPAPDTTEATDSSKGSTQDAKTTEPEDPTANAQTEEIAVDELGTMAYEDESYMGMPIPSQGYNTEEYAAVEETGFVSTKSSPLSTISADVDTASYANLRRMLRDGYKTLVASDTGKNKDESSKQEVAEDPIYYDDYYYEASGVIPAGAVRIEEMLNYFDYDYPTPEGDDLFRITARMGKCPWNKDSELLVLGYATGEEDQSAAQKGSNLVFLIDVSGSMDEADKLPLLQSSFGELVKSLGENDRVSIVTYSGEEEVVLEGAKGSDQQQIMRAVRGLKADGSTNGEAGLRMAYEVAEKNFIEGGVNRIVMASDGDLNVGMTSESDLHDFVDGKRDKGIYLSVLGFGAGNYKDNKMETLADHGNGSYHYIDCEAEAERVFGQRLTANLVPFADDVKMQIEFNPAQIKAYRLIGYENRAMADEDFQNDEKDAGEVGPSSQFTVMYEVVRANSAMEFDEPELKYEQTNADANTSNEWLTAKLRYQPAAGGDVREQELVVSEQDLSDDPGKDWRFAAAVGEFGMLLRDSDYKGTSTFQSVRDLVEAGDDPLRTEFLDLVGLAERN